jgi:hypothetical protein
LWLRGERTRRLSALRALRSIYAVRQSGATVLWLRGERHLCRSPKRTPELGVLFGER